MKGNKPLDREYFRLKDKPELEAGKYSTPCCNQAVDRDILNVNKQEDWALIEKHIEQSLSTYSSTESITPVICKKCGRLREYRSILKLDKKLPGD